MIGFVCFFGLLVSNSTSFVWFHTSLLSVFLSEWVKGGAKLPFLGEYLDSHTVTPYSPPPECAQAGSEAACSIWYW